MEEKAKVQDQSGAEHAEEVNTTAEETTPHAEAPNEAEQAPEKSREEVLESEVVELKDKYLRLQADLENMRKRHARERIDLIHGASNDLIKELLPVLDDFERAIAHEEQKGSEQLEGLNLIYNKFKRTLEGKGLKAMDAMHQPFDTEFHEAITNIPAPSEDLKGKVVDVTEKGYFIQDTVIRYAKVVVGQ